MASAKWFYQVMGEETGPVTSAELKRLATSGTVARDTLIRQGVSGRWTSAEKVTGLFNGDAPDSHLDSESDTEPTDDPPSPPKAAVTSALSVEERTLPPVLPPHSLKPSKLFFAGSVLNAVAGVCLLIAAVLLVVSTSSSRSRNSPLTRYHAAIAGKEKEETMRERLNVVLRNAKDKGDDELARQWENRVEKSWERTRAINSYLARADLSELLERD